MAKHVFCDRDHSAALYTRALAKVCRRYAFDQDVSDVHVIERHGSPVLSQDPHVSAGAMSEYLSTFVYRELRGRACVAADWVTAELTASGGRAL